MNIDKIKLEGAGTPVLSLDGRTLRVVYDSIEAYTARVSADDTAIRKAVKVLSAESPAPIAPNQPAPTEVLYTLAG